MEFMENNTHTGWVGVGGGGYTPTLIFLFHPSSAAFLHEHFCWFILVNVLEAAQAQYPKREAWPVGRCLPPHYPMQMKRVHMFNI